MDIESSLTVGHAQWSSAESLTDRKCPAQCLLHRVTVQTRTTFAKLSVLCFWFIFPGVDVHSASGWKLTDYLRLLSKPCS